jgi:chaperonin GroEL (HSP60 family)
MRAQVATVPGNNESALTVEESRTIEATLDTVEGMEFDRGYMSPYFVTDPDRMHCELENCFILITDKKIASIREILPILDRIVKHGRSLLIIAKDVDEEALATLVLNKLKGRWHVAAVKAPGVGDRRKAMLKYIAILTNGRSITEHLGINLENINLDDLGTAKKVVIDKGKTTIAGGGGKKRPGPPVRFVSTETIIGMSPSLKCPKCLADDTRRSHLRFWELPLLWLIVPFRCRACAARFRRARFLLGSNQSSRPL